MPATVTFALNTADLDAPARAVLDQAALRIARLDQPFVEIVGHADQRGNEPYNQSLSFRRANAVAAYLRQRVSLPVQAVAVQAVGKSQPADARDHARNRRVTIAWRGKEAVPRRPMPLAVSGGTVYVGASDGSVLGRDLVGQCDRIRLAASGRGATAVAVSPNGRLVLSGHDDGSLRLWDGATGSLLTTMYGHAGGVNGLDFYPPLGTTAVSAGEDGRVLMWNMTTGVVAASFDHHKAPVTAVAFSPDRHYVLSGDASGRVLFWNPLSRQVLGEARAHAGPVAAVGFSSTSPYAFTAGNDRSVAVWDVANHSELRRIPLPGAVHAFAVADNGQTVLVGDDAGRLLKYSAVTGRKLAEAAAHSGPVRSIVVTSNRQVVTAALGEPLGRFTLGELSRVGAVARPVTAPMAPFEGAGPGAVWHDPRSGLELVWVPPGCFVLGCAPGDAMCAFDRNDPREVCVGGFWMGRREVTRTEWSRAMGGLPAQPRAAEPEPDDAPVGQVSWGDAQQFMCRLNGAGAFRYRIPTEAEWEYACRVGGLEGMQGGAWEWVADVYSATGYGPLAVSAPVNLGDSRNLFGSSSVRRTTRGGAWQLTGTGPDCAFRDNTPEAFKGSFLGFRVLMEPARPADEGEAQPAAPESLLPRGGQ